jgi:pSer/pThr/pTyr-binding forkhead associated (FHA) protein
LADIEDDNDFLSSDEITALAPAAGGGAGGAGRGTPQAEAIAYIVRKDTGERIAVTSQRTSIGRSNDNRVVINDASVSRVHAQLHVNRHGGFSLTDLDSLNGTFVNDRKIKGTQDVKAGDTVAFGTIKANIFKA